MNQNTQLQAPDLSSYSVSIIDSAYTLRTDALALSKGIVAVTTAKEQQDAITCAGMIKELVSKMEKTRKEVKAPVLAAGSLIDKTASGYSGALEQELTRLERLASNWQLQEHRRLEVIRQEQERKNREAEQAAEAERRAYLDIIAKADAASLEAVRRAADEAAERNAEAARERHMAVLAIAPSKAAGARTSVANDYEILDLAALAEARPDLVSIEPKRALLKAAVQIPGASIPGVRIFEEVRVSAKASL